LSKTTAWSVVRGNRFAISKRSSIWGSRTCCIVIPAADFRDQVDLALGPKRGEIGVLKDLAVDSHRHAFLDPAAEAGEAPIWPADREALPNAQGCGSS
jgi:hypothetical protein